MRILAIIALTVSAARAELSARFNREDLIIRNATQSVRINGLLDPHVFYRTIHAVRGRGQDFFVVYGTSEMSRGWPGKGGNCGCGLESYIRWIHVKDGKIIEQQEGRQESCDLNRDGWAIAWKDGSLVWETEGLEREGDPIHGKLISFAYFWSFDPSRPESGIVETKKLTEWQPNNE